jgi:Cu/Ag efflux pump CusA
VLAVKRLNVLLNGFSHSGLLQPSFESSSQKQYAPVSRLETVKNTIVLVVFLLLGLELSLLNKAILVQVRVPFLWRHLNTLMFSIAHMMMLYL